MRRRRKILITLEDKGRGGMYRQRKRLVTLEGEGGGEGEVRRGWKHWAREARKGCQGKRRRQGVERILVDVRKARKGFPRRACVAATNGKNTKLGKE